MGMKAVIMAGGEGRRLKSVTGELPKPMVPLLGKPIMERCVELLRRAGFAQSIISDPEILLLDEPTDGLDPNQKEHMRRLIADMKKNKTVLISTHLLDEAESIATRIILINRGRILVDGTLKDILFKAEADNLEKAFSILTRPEKNDA